jgi:thioredoxin-related protein
MKKILLILTLLSTLLMSNELKTEKFYKKALETAKNQNKSVLFMTSIKGCPVCDYMKDIVFEREAVLDYLNKNFVVVIKDVETQIYPKRFYTRDMPTFYFIDPTTEKELRAPKSGGLTPEKFLVLLQSAIEQNLNTTDQNSTVTAKN